MASSNCRIRIWAIPLGPKLRHHHEQYGPGQRGDERPGVERQRERLQQHENTDGNDGRGDHLRRSATQPARPATLRVDAHWTPTLAASLANAAAALPPEGAQFAPWGGPAALICA